MFKILQNTFLSLVVLGFFIQLSVKPSNAQTVSKQQLDRLSIQELYVLYNEQARQASIVVNNCDMGAASYPMMQTSCNIMRMQYQHYFAQLQNYIAQREVIGR